MYDTLIRNGMVFDGSQDLPVKMDVALKDGRVAAVAPNLANEAGQVVDAAGKYVTPGFIDPHSHSDFSLLIEPDGDSKLRQGVTTEVVGNCGETPAPAYGQWLEDITLSRFSPDGVSVTWRSFGEYLAHFARLKPIVNVAPLVGHGAIRGSVAGIEDRQPTPSEMAKMKELTYAAMAEGAWGLSSGLIYPPGVYSQTDELVELARVVEPFGGFYASHVRGEGRTVLSAVNEALEIGQRAGVPVQVSHLKVSGYRTWHLIDDLMQLVERARGLDVPAYFDQYPYAASSTGLLYMLPEWTYVGGLEESTRRLADPASRRQLRQQMEESPDIFWDYGGVKDWDGVLITDYAPRAEYQGKTVGEIAHLLDSDPLDTLLDLLVESRCIASCVLFEIYEPNVRRIMQHDLVMVSSDGYSVKSNGYRSKRSMHPRSYGTFPRVLGHYTREEKVLAWPQAVYKMTGLPARALGLTDRGALRPGAWADVVVLDPKTVIDRATFMNAHQYPVGIEYVWVNGQLAVADSQTTGTRAGAVLPRPH